MQVALPADWPQSAVAAEMYAVLVAGYILARGDADGCPHAPGSVTLVADCEAVCRAGLWNPYQQMSEKFIFASCWEDFAGGPIGTIHKVSAHLTRQTAISGGWETDWVGNDVADELAKDARTEVEGHGML